LYKAFLVSRRYKYFQYHLAKPLNLLQTYIMIMRILIALLLTLPFVGFSQNLRSGGPLKPEQAIMDIRHYTIALDIDPKEQFISGYTDIDLILLKETDVLLFDFWHGLKVTGVYVNGQEKTFQHGEDDLIRIAQSLTHGKVKVKIKYEGKPGIAERAPWTGGFQWEKDSKGNPWISLTCQSEGGKIFFPCKDHPSDEPNDGADLILTVPAGLVAAGPGLLVKQSTRKDKTTFHWKTKYTISNYCLVFNVGKYTKLTRMYTTINGNKVPMEYYVLEENVSKGEHLLERMERTAHVLEKYFGEYPWIKEKIGLCETPHLGMEHQTLIAYGNQYRYTKVGGEDFDWLLNHEFGHEWWANKVTNRDWAHMWIQEGICSFGDALYIRELEGEEAYLKRMQAIAIQTENRAPMVQGDEIDSDQAYQSDIYGKGAFFMHTLRHVIGDEKFFPALKKLATDPKYTYDNTVVTDDVEAVFTEAYGKSVKPLFDLFVYSSNKMEISLKQTAPTTWRAYVINLDMDIPIEVSTDSGLQKMTIGKNHLIFESKTLPVIDPKVYYLKKVILEP
jgi:aminopeptidase N